MWLYTEVAEWVKEWTFPAAVTKWVTESSPYRTFHQIWQCDLSVKNLSLFIKKMNREHVLSAKELYHDYNKFIAVSATHKNSYLSENEKLVFDLTSRKKELTKTENEKLQTLLLELELNGKKQRELTFHIADILVDAIKKYCPLPLGENLDTLIDTLIIDYKERNDIDLDEIIFLVRAKIYLLDADNKTTEAKIIAYVVPVYNEFNRLKPKSQTFTGEDFLRVKCKQLQFLYRECKNLDWQLFIADDASPHSSLRTIDEVNDIIKKSDFDEIRNKITCLGYENLEDQIKAYEDEVLSKLSPSEFAEKSVKGGAVHCALRYLIGIENVDCVVLTDADLSTNLGITGRVIWETLCGNAEMAIGSRRLPGSVVVGKSSDRHLLSFAFNFLTHLLLNIQVSDTQVGCKAISINAINKIHKKLNDTSMTFDVEIIRCMQDMKLSVTSVPTYWRDSPFESKSAGESQNMFAGLIGNFRRMYSLEQTNSMSTEAMTEEKAFKHLAALLLDEPEFPALMQLANNKKFHFLVEFSSDIYSILTPRAWRNFVEHLILFLTELAAGNIKQATLNALFEDIQKLYNQSRETPAVEFLLAEFPEIFSIAELIYKNRDYAQIIAPLLFGERIFGRVFSKLHYIDFIEWQKQTDISLSNESVNQLFKLWCESGQRREPLAKTEPEAYLENKERQHQGLLRLKSLSDLLTYPKKVSLVMQYDQDATSKEYVDKVVRGKIRALSELAEQTPNINFELIVIDARSQRTSGIDTYINHVLKHESRSEKFQGRQIVVPSKYLGTGKPSAIRYGLTVACDEGADILGYIDFSNKIPIKDISHLIADVIQAQQNQTHIASIGSRRLTSSEVLNKPLTFLLRSTGLNLTIKSLFPELFHLSDTQTGFKCFSNVAWKTIKDKLQSQSLAFDVEILAAFTQHHYAIQEQPVTFNDNNLDNTELSGPANEMLPDLLRIRSRFQKSMQNASIDNPIRMGAGAEHTVYDLGDGSLLKVPTQFADPNFMILLKNLVFNKTQNLGSEDRETGLFISQFNQIINSKYLQSYVPLLRNITDINVFVMRMISALENKTKSFDLHKVLQRGNGLIGPFEFCEPFSICIDGTRRTFDDRHQVKRSLRAVKLFNDEFISILQAQENEADNVNLKTKVKKLKNLIDQAVLLFEKMWQRGLYDLDTNILSDLGYFNTKDGLQLMSLDPGEVTDDISLIDINIATNLLPKRSDILLMRTQLSSFPSIDTNEIVNYYIEKMLAFFEAIRHDIALPPGERNFGSDLRNYPNEDFSIHCHFSPLPFPDKKLASYTEEEISQFLSAGYQLPYTSGPLTDIQSKFSGSDQRVHILVNKKEGYSIPSFDSDIVETERGSILPLCRTISEKKWLTSEKNVTIVLDAGSGTRSSLLGLAAGSKGQIVLGGNSLTAYASQMAQNVSDTLTQNDFTDYVIITSCDDLISADESYLNNITEYFELTPQPGLFWCDLPESGKSYMPLSTKDTFTFLNSHFVRDKIEHFFKSIPVTRGYAEADIVNKTMNALAHLYNGYQQWSGPINNDGQEQVEPSFLPGLSEVSDRYIKLLHWYGMVSGDAGGLKKPFMMVMSKAFLTDFINDVIPIIPEYIKTQITWENLLLRALKADAKMWQTLGKPALVTSRQWNNIYNAIQNLKAKHSIDTENSHQNALRGKPPIWQSLDDPYAVFTTSKRIYEKAPSHIYRSSSNKCTLISDQPINENNSLIVESDFKTTIVAIDSCVQGEIHIAHLKGSAVTHKNEHQVLLYGIDLSSERRLHPIPGHVVVEIDGEIYSTSLIPATKSALKNQPVYHYDSVTGLPDPVPVKNLDSFKQYIEEAGALYVTSLRQ